MTTRSQTRTLRVGNVQIGGGAAIAIQSMTKTDTRDIAKTLGQINKLHTAGCEIARVAIPDIEAAEAFCEIKKNSPLPLVADIHFDYKLAMLAIKYGADKIRVNPGNIGGEEKMLEVARAAKDAGIPIRIGVNSGSLEKKYISIYGGITSQGLCESALHHINLLESIGFYDIVVSIKASNIPMMLESCTQLAAYVNYPLHIGVTEAGPGVSGAVRSAAGIGSLLMMGIGDTIRVSLTSDPEDEVLCAKEILQALGFRVFGPTLISCPTCGRTEIDLRPLVNDVDMFLQGLKDNIRVAVMGCAVNGPGEARDADYGVAGGKGFGVLFKNGNIIKKVPDDMLADELIKLIKSELAPTQAQV